MAKNVGVDLGYGFVKATDGEREVVFPSVVGPARERVHSDFSLFATGLDNLTITVGDRTHFVGDLAIRQSEVASRSLDEHRVDDPSARVLVLTALALFTQWDEGQFNVVTGLPSAFYASLKDAWLNQFRGTFHVRFSDGGEMKEKRITIDKIRVVPQPLGTLYDRVLNEMGQVADRELAQQTVGVVDIGFKTSDFAVARGMEYIDRLSGSITTGLSSAYSAIAARLRTDYQIHRENHEMDEIVERGQVRIAGRPQDISHIKKEAFERVAQRVLTELESLWNYRDLDVMLVTGGGGTALSDHLLARFDNARLVDGAQLANVRGYAKLANNIFRGNE